MRNDNSAIAVRRQPLSSGIAWGFVGVAAFSLTVPFTRIATRELDPLFVGGARAVVAGILAMALLVITGTRLPTRREFVGTVLVGLGVVFGFPVFTSVALTSTTAGHSAVIIGLLPMMTAIVAVLMTDERPQLRFWIYTAGGAASVVLYSIVAHSGVGSWQSVDLYLFAAVALGALGYAQGGITSRTLGAWQTISWALVVALPAMVVIGAVGWARTDLPLTDVGGGTWLAFGYLGVVSMFLGFFAWYRGLALGPMSRVSQVQLVQPVMTLGWSVLLLSERITWTMALSCLVTISCAVGAVGARSATVVSRSGVRTAPPAPPYPSGAPYLSRTDASR